MIAPLSPIGTKIITETWYLALVAWREARGESQDAQVAVAWSVMNRVARPKWWGKTISQVVGKAWQYSSMTNPNDPQATRAWPLDTDPSWQLALGVAKAVLEGTVENPLPGADSYYDTSILAPSWTTGARFCGQIGKLRFFDVDHDFEAPAVASAATAAIPQGGA